MQWYRKLVIDLYVCNTLRGIHILSLSKLLTQIKNDSDIWQSEIHGLDHWDRVLENGLWLGKDSEAELKVIEYFAYLHDCCRENEGYDPRHGPRGLLIYAKQHRDVYLTWMITNLVLLTRACAGHTFAMPIGQAGHNSTSGNMLGCR